MARAKVTIPQSGKKRVNISGCSLVVESAPAYLDPGHVPTFRFISGGSVLPIYPRSTYPSNEGFSQIEIHSTPQSAGDEIRLLAVDEFLPTNININTRQTSRIDVGDTKEKSLLDQPLYFSNGEKILGGHIATAVDIYVAKSDALVAFNDVTPTQNPVFGKVLKAGEHYKIAGQDRIDTAQFINYENGIESILTFDMDF